MRMGWERIHFIGAIFVMIALLATPLAKPSNCVENHHTRNLLIAEIAIAAHSGHEGDGLFEVHHAHRHTHASTESEHSHKHSHDPDSPFNQSPTGLLPPGYFTVAAVQFSDETQSLMTERTVRRISGRVFRPPIS